MENLTLVQSCEGEELDPSTILARADDLCFRSLAPQPLSLTLSVPPSELQVVALLHICCCYNKTFKSIELPKITWFTLDVKILLPGGVILASSIPATSLLTGKALIIKGLILGRVLNWAIMDPFLIDPYKSFNRFLVEFQILTLKFLFRTNTKRRTPPNKKGVKHQIGRKQTP